MGYGQALHFVPDSMMSHVAKLFLDCLMPFHALRWVWVVIGIVEGHQLDWVMVESFGEVDWLNLHLFFCIESEIWQGIDHKRGEVEIFDLLIGFDLLNLVIFFIPSQSISLLDRIIIRIIVVGGAMAINVIHCVQIIGCCKLVHHMERSQQCLGGMSSSLLATSLSLSPLSSLSMSLLSSSSSLSSSLSSSSLSSSSLLEA